MYNRLYLYLIGNILLYNKLFGFQKGHSTDHAIVQLADQIHDMFNKNIYTLGGFTDLPKATDTVHHKILVKKLSIYGIKNKSSNRKQFIGYNVNSKSPMLDIVCGVPRVSILAPLLLLPYINNLPKASKLLDPIMFADDTFLVNKELSNISHWFNSSKISLNADKTKFTLFHKVRQRENIPLVLPNFKINSTPIKRVDHIKFLKVLFDENLTWKNHTNLIENKISKSLGILHQV